MATSVPAPQSNPPDPQVVTESSRTVSNVSRATLLRNDPATSAQYEKYRANAEQALTEKYVADGSSLQFARDEARIDAAVAANQQFAPQIVAAGAGTFTNTTNPLLPQQQQPQAVGIVEVGAPVEVVNIRRSPVAQDTPEFSAPVSSARTGTLGELQQELATQQARIPPLVNQLNTSLSRSQLLQQQIQQRRDIIAGLDGPRRQAPPGLTALAGSGSVGVQRARAVAALQILENQLAAEASIQSSIEAELRQVEQTIQDLQRAIASFIQTPNPVQLTQLQPSQNSAALEQAALEQARSQAQVAVQRGQASQGDWRVKLRLAGSADYLYRANEPGILAPLAETDGVVFPYMPDITTNYVANYNNYDLTHSNYRGYFYQNSQVSEISITATFTAQDTYEAEYLLAVIHFFKSVTKMFYGQDTSQYRGAPPPLVFLQGLGEFQFNLAPCVVNNFNYVLPSDVDYIRARVANVDGTNLLVRRNKQALTGGESQPSRNRLTNAGIPPGAIYTRPPPPTLGTSSPTYVPTKMQISITLLPVQTRAQVSREFSLEQFANGSLIQRGFW